VLDGLTWLLGLSAVASVLAAGFALLAWRRAADQAAASELARQALQQALRDLRSELQQTIHQSVQTQSDAQDRLALNLTRQLHELTALNDRRQHELRATVDQRLRELHTDNAQRLEAMRMTVDEKLHATLEQRLGESFKLVSDRLEAVHQGLGDMQRLAAGVGDLQRVLTNVKVRGTWGEVQLGMLLEQVLSPTQYQSNVKTNPLSDELVEFAIRLPGQASDQPVWLPIDAKFPKEDYERLLDAQDRADADAVKQAGHQLARSIELEAKRIASKYISPPSTTDFALMFLPSEGLYAEVLRRPGLLDRLQALRINIAGPSSLAALLNSLQMGFRTLAIEQRSSEVWKVLGVVKSEFNKFGASLASVKKTLETASNKLGQTEQRTRVMLRNLQQVEALPAEGEPGLLTDMPPDDSDEPTPPAA